MGQASSSSLSTDYSKVNSLKPSSERTAPRRGALPPSPKTKGAQNDFPTNQNQSNMYQSLRSYVGKNAKLPGYMDYLHLSTGDVTTLKSTWAEVDNHITRVGVEFFLDMFHNHGDIKEQLRQHPHLPVYEIKANEDLHRHSIFVLGAIKTIIKHIDDTEYLERFLDDLSDKHRSAGVDASSMELFGKVFVKVMRPVLLEKRKWKPEVKDSWMTFFTSIVKVMKKNETQTKGEGGAEADEGERVQTSQIVFKRNTYDRHLIQVGCDTFTQLFKNYPEVNNYMAEFDDMEVDGIKVGGALRAHTTAVQGVVAEIQENAGNPERIRSSLAAAGNQQFEAGVRKNQLDHLGPVICHVIRPLVWEKGLWNIEVEKSWTHLFDIASCLMKLGYPEMEEQEEDAFPTFAQTVFIRDTWEVILRQINTLGMETFQKLFEINSDVSAYLSPTSICDLDPAIVKNTTDAVKAHATHTITLIQNAVNNISSLDKLTEDMVRLGKLHSTLGIDHGILDVIGPVFCNTTRPFLVMQVTYVKL